MLLPKTVFHLKGYSTEHIAPKTMKNKRAVIKYNVARKRDIAACDQQMRRTAYASVKSDQRLYSSLPGKYSSQRLSNAKSIF